MKIEQKKLSNRHTFLFEPDHVNFSYRDHSGSGDIDIPYAEFPLKFSTRIVQNTWLRNVGYLWCFLGVVQIGLALLASNPTTGFWLAIGAICLLWEKFTKVTYTIFSTKMGSVWVIQDGDSHQRILDEIRLRRKNQLLTWYGEINLENGLAKEIEKYRWLAEQDALTSDEAEVRIAQVSAALAATEVESHMPN